MTPYLPTPNLCVVCRSAAVDTLNWEIPIGTGEGNTLIMIARVGACAQPEHKEMVAERFAPALEAGMREYLTRVLALHEEKTGPDAAS